jgi:hypothetical protein
MKARLAVLAALLACAAIWPEERKKPAEIAYTFESGAQHWQVYDYNGGKKGGPSAFHPVSWATKGGVKNSGYVWGDDSRWRIDTPEKPASILAFFTRRSYARQGAVDLRGAEVSVHLRGDKLDLKGGKCLFWAFSDDKGTRWHYRGHPLSVPEGKWSKKQTFTLVADEKKWHRSWARDPKKPGRLADVLATCDSYGFSFVGFKEEVAGKFAMDELVIRPKK